MGTVETTEASIDQCATTQRMSLTTKETEGGVCIPHQRRAPTSNLSHANE